MSNSSRTIDWNALDDKSRMEVLRNQTTIQSKNNRAKRRERIAALHLRYEANERRIDHLESVLRELEGELFRYDRHHTTTDRNVASSNIRKIGFTNKQCKDDTYLHFVTTSFPTSGSSLRKKKITPASSKMEFSTSMLKEIGEADRPPWFGEPF